MTLQPLDQPFVSTSALRAVNFFNGRLLTGEDLRQEQATQEARVDRLGRALGDGVAHGLDVVGLVSAAPRPVVRISPGLALTRSGAALELSAPVDVALDQTAPPPDSGAVAGGAFGACQPSATATYSAGNGVYLLAVGPGRQGEGRARVGGLEGSGPCTVSLSVETVSFRLIRLALVNELQNLELLRNRVAYDCFGVGDTARVLIDPFGSRPAQWGLVDRLRPQPLAPDEVPLATIGWSIDTGIQFVDLWSVRRRPTRPPSEGGWAVLAGDRRSAEAEAMFLQFQEHLGELLRGPFPESIVAAHFFERLPPIGLVPVTVPGAIRPGVDLATFFTGAKTRGPMFVEGAKLEPLLRQALAAAPMTTSRSLIWLYWIREAVDPRAWSGAQPGGPYALFTTGEVRYAGEPQFDLSHWNYANFALRAD